MEELETLNMDPDTSKSSGLTAADLPPAIRAFWDSAPASFKVPAILTAIDCYCALATRLRFKYTYDLDPHALLLQVLVVAEAASGKSFTRPIVKSLMQPLKLRDQEMKRIEQAYQDLKKTSAKNKQLPEEPITDVRCLQTITKAKLVKRADMFIRKYGEPLTFWFYNEELATMTESNKRAFADLRTMDRLAYDLGAEYGSDTLSDASYNADVDVIYCSLFCATDNALREYMDKRSVEGGNCTRKVLTDLGDLMGEDAPRFRPLTPEEQAVVSRTVQHLMDITYTDEGQLQPIRMVPMEWLDYHVRRWCSDQRQLVLKTGSRARNCFYKRASVSAARMCCLLYYLWQVEQGFKFQVSSSKVEQGFETAQQRCAKFQVSSSKKKDLKPETVVRPMKPQQRCAKFQVSSSKKKDLKPETVVRPMKLETAVRPMKLETAVRPMKPETVVRPMKPETAQQRCAKFYRFMATYILDGLLARWGRQYEQMHKTDETDDGAKAPLYDQLPAQFSRDQLRELIVKLDLSTPARIFISKWKRAKLIYESETKDIFVKNY